MKRFRQWLAKRRKNKALQDIRRAMQKQKTGLVVKPEILEELGKILDRYQYAVDFDLDVDGDEPSVVVANIVLLSVGYEDRKNNPKKYMQDEIGTISLRNKVA
jgi:hypothetical protein